MVFFWDKNIGKRIPLAVRSLKPPGISVELYKEHFKISDIYPEGGDDSWLASVGAWGWNVITQDYSYHKKPAELFAMKQYNVGCFYLWGAKAHKWDTMRVFMKSYDHIVEVASNTPKPFIFRVEKMGD